MYKIIINYDTGNSFTTNYGVEEDLELTWENLDNAKKALQAIKEHYKYYNALEESYSFLRVEEKENIDKIIKESKTKDWYCKEFDLSIILQADNGNSMQMSAFWCGYFERLNWVEINVIGDSDMRFEIN